MGRQSRDQQRGYTLHIYSRTSNYKKIYHLGGDWVKKIFENVLVRALEKFNFELMAYGILDNHFHLIIRTNCDGDYISTIMQFIKSVFAKKFNQETGQTGPVWNERYGMVIVEKQENPPDYFLRLIWYIYFNPVRAGKVKDPRDYVFSSINHYLRVYIHPIKITFSEYFTSLSDSFHGCIEEFLKYEEYYRKRIFYF